MTTIINTPGQGGDNDGGMGAGLILGIIITVLAIIVLFYVYGWPALKGDQQQQPDTNVNIQIPKP